MALHLRLLKRKLAQLSERQQADRTDIDGLSSSKLNASVWNDAHEQFSIEGSYWSYQNGKVVSEAVWKRTPKIPLNRDAPIILKNVSQAGNAATCFFDVGGNFISAVKGSYGALVTIEPSAYPEDAVFVGISTRIEEDTTYSNGDTVEAREGTVADAVMGSANVALIKEAEAAGAVYNRSTGFFELNGLTDITEAQMREILLHTAGRQISSIQLNTFNCCKAIRTHLPVRLTPQINLAETFCFSFNLEVIKLESYYGAQSPIQVLNIDAAFKECRKLKKIDCELQLLPSQSIALSTFYNCFALEEVRLKGVKVNVNFATCPKLSSASLQYLVDNAANTSAITVTVHPDVYAKLTGDTSNAAAAALTAEELAQWQAIATEASGKNISFATSN